MKHSLLFLFLCFVTSVEAQLSGNYTIDPNKAADSVNYQNIESAIKDLKDGKRTDTGAAIGPGISGNVTFLIADGSYKTQLIVSGIQGVSDTSQINFTSQSGDSSKVKIHWPSTSNNNNNYILYLASNYINFSGITFERTGDSTYANVIYVQSARYCTFKNCVIKGTFNIYSGTDASGIYINGGDNYNIYNNLFIDSCKFGFFF